jgi:DNA-binding response OmpR family regulator
MSKVAIEETRRIILSVNDSPTMGKEMFDWFQDRGVAVVRARSTAKAMEWFRRIAFDAIISNLRRFENNMQGNHAGIELAKLVRIDNKQVPIFIYTSNVDAATRQLALMSGATSVATLPGELQTELKKRGF